MNFLDDLNPEQRAAVETEGPLIVIAGPGTGKTKTLVSKLVYLLTVKKVDPTQIAALTFTNKAAAEMRSRVEQLFTGPHFAPNGATRGEPVALTRLPAEVPPKADKGRATRFDAMPFIGTFHALAYELLRQQGKTVRIVEEVQRSEMMKQVRQDIGMNAPARRELELTIAREKSSMKQPSDAVRRYNELLRQEGVLDYDDLLLEVLLSATRLFHYILVDEFQDTNDVQYALLKKITAPGGVVTVIGDPLQSIYAFRGAKPESFDAFKRDFPHYREITLTRNYRSGTRIVAASHALFPGSPLLQPMSSHESSVTMVTTLNERTEAQWIAAEIERLMGGMDLNETGQRGGGRQQGARFSDFAVIYRTHDVGRSLSQTFSESGIPYQVIGGNSLYEQPEIVAIIEALSTTAGTRDETHPLSQHVTAITNEMGLSEKVKASPYKHHRFQEFLNSLVRFDGQRDGLKRFLEYVRYLKEHEYYDHAADRATLLTMHAAKGLEFSYVFIGGFEEGLIPYTAKAVTEQELAEEKRLLYVAMTRAKHALYLLEARHRRRRPTESSRFKSLFRTEAVEDSAIERARKRYERVREAKSQLPFF